MYISEPSLTSLLADCPVYRMILSDSINSSAELRLLNGSQFLQRDFSPVHLEMQTMCREGFDSKYSLAVAEFMHFRWPERSTALL
jgi:hypothetical protein